MGLVRREQPGVVEPAPGVIYDVVGDDRAQAVSDHDDAIVEPGGGELGQQVDPGLADLLPRLDIVGIGAEVARRISDHRHNPVGREQAERRSGQAADRDQRLEAFGNHVPQFGRDPVDQGHGETRQKQQEPRGPVEPEPFRHRTRQAHEQRGEPSRRAAQRVAGHQVGPVELEELEPARVGGDRPPRRHAAQLEAAGDGLGLGEYLAAVGGDDAAVVRPCRGDEPPQRAHRPLLAHAVDHHDSGLALGQRGCGVRVRHGSISTPRPLLSMSVTPAGGGLSTAVSASFAALHAGPGGLPRFLRLARSFSCSASRRGSMSSSR